MRQEGKHAAAAHVHVVSFRLLLAVWLALVVLTVITVGVTWIDVGSLNIVVALAVATVKASLVLLYFMHLRWEKPFNAVILLVALLFVGLFVGGTLIDTLEYKPELIPGYAPEMERAAPPQ